LSEQSAQLSGLSVSGFIASGNLENRFGSLSTVVG